MESEGFFLKACEREGTTRYTLSKRPKRINCASAKMKSVAVAWSTVRKIIETVLGKTYHCLTGTSSNHGDLLIRRSSACMYIHRLQIIGGSLADVESSSNGSYQRLILLRFRDTCSRSIQIVKRRTLQYALAQQDG